MSDSRPTPDLATVILDAIAVEARSVRVALPGRIESYDPDTQTCSALPLVQDGRKDETGTRRAVRLPVVQNVPVVFPGAGGYSITWPLAAGDTVLLVFASSSIDRWLALGGEVDPVLDHHHHVTDAIAIAGLRALPDALGGGATDGGAMVVSAPTIKLGGAAATEPAVKGDSLAAALTTVMNAISAYATGIKTVADPTDAFTATLLAAIATFLSALDGTKSTVVKIGG